MTSLPTTTTERLFAVADLIEAHPDRWDQELWTGGGEEAGPLDEEGRGGDCGGGTACVAGWAVRLTPAGTLPETRDEWHDAGREVLGLSDNLAEVLFDAEFAPESMPGVLRLIATIPEGGRTLRAAIEAGMTDLRKAGLRGANLSRANLRRANLSGASLGRTNFEGADLRKANLCGAILREANLNGTDLRWADLRGADLGKTNLSGAYLDGALADEGTILPAECSWRILDGRVRYTP